MHYIEVKVHCNVPFRDILIAEMAELDFESFIETEVGFDAYITESLFNHPGLQQLFNNYRKQTRIWYELKKIPKTNWNETWEKNYAPVRVGDQVYIRAAFHDPDREVPYEVVITPRMSFGTGHHETTRQMLALQLQVDYQDKVVLDVGSGTGILAIMAAKLGAAAVTATDIDDWCIENARENFEQNNVSPKNIWKGYLKELNLRETFDIIMANINKSVLLGEIGEYARLTRPGGHLILSGFYDHDEEEILLAASGSGFKKITALAQRRWMAVLLKKI